MLQIPDAELWQCSKLVDEHLNSVAQKPRFKTLATTDTQDEPFPIIGN